MSVIVVGVDGSDQSMCAVEWAAEEALRRDLRLRLVHVEPEWLYDEPSETRAAALREWLLTGAGDMLHRAVTTARRRSPHVVVETEHLTGQVARVLLERSDDAAMIAVGCRGAGAAAGLLLGSTTLQVVTHTKIPAVVVRQPPGAARGEIVVGADGSAVSEPAIGFAFEEAALRRTRLRTIHVWSHPASRWPGDMRPLVYDPQLIAEEELSRVERSEAGWREKFPDVEVVSEAVHGRPAAVLAGASVRADLLVVGTRGRGGFTGLLLGSVSHALLHQAQCPLAVIPVR